MVRTVTHLLLDAGRVPGRFYLKAIALEQRLHVLTDGFVVVDDENSYGGKLRRHRAPPSAGVGKGGGRGGALGGDLHVVAPSFGGRSVYSGFPKRFVTVLLNMRNGDREGLRRKLSCEIRCLTPLLKCCVSGGHFGDQGPTRGITWNGVDDRSSARHKGAPAACARRSAPARRWTTGRSAAW